ncbi:MAG: FKBP-type peptidyl-prolyl cis-trans isomerase [Phycisphaerales bacterium]
MSKLIIEDLVVGTGAEVKAGSAVTAHYRGTLREGGAEFDSSHKRGEPANFPLSGVIVGWQKGVPGMRIGGKRRLTVPAAMGYGSQAIRDGGKVMIPANSDLVFEIEMVAALMVEDLVVGKGREVREGDTVTAHYRGTLLKGGKEFDSSYESGEPAEFPLDQVIEGWQFGIPGMRVGGKRKLTIPWQMAYGEAGSPPDIPARADLVFEVEMIGVE